MTWCRCRGCQRTIERLQQSVTVSGFLKLTCGVVWPEAAQDSQAAVEGGEVTSEQAHQHLLQQVHVDQPVVHQQVNGTP